MRALYLPFVLGLIAACGPSANRGTCTDSANCDMGPCNAGETRTCYTGAAGTEGVGPCVGGNQSCTAGGTWSDCVGQVLPAPEMCGDGVDNNCNGMVDKDIDEDGDGYTTCGGDCCDSVSVCGDPAGVNPGAIEVAVCSTGLIGEIVVRTYFESQDRRIYAVKRVISQTKK